MLILAPALGAPSIAVADIAAGWHAFENGDYARADGEWRALAEGGDRNAQFALGMLAEAQDREVEAIEWYRRAAEAGLSNAQVVLGARYANGLGVETDLVKAYEWLDRAAGGDHPNAAAFRDSLLSRMTPEQRAAVTTATE